MFVKILAAQSRQYLFFLVLNKGDGLFDYLSQPRVE